MAKTKKTRKKKNNRFFSKFFGKNSKNSPEKLDIATILHTTGIVLFLGGSVFGLRYLDRFYVRNLTAERNVELTMELVNAPEWATGELIKFICLTSDIQADDALWNDRLVDMWQENLLSNPWVKQVRHIRKRYDGRVLIDAALRKPMVYIAQGGKRFFLDEEGMILNEMPVKNVHLIKIRGLVRQVGVPGEIVTIESVRGAIKILKLIQEVDNQLYRSDRIWQELVSIDIANYEGQLNHNTPHVILHSRKGARIFWGTAIGREVPYYEKSPQAKLRKLYSMYQSTGFNEEFSPIDLRI